MRPVKIVIIICLASALALVAAVSLGQLKERRETENRERLIRATAQDAVKKALGK